MKQFILLPYLLITIINDVYTQPGKLDPRFGSNGIFIDSNKYTLSRSSLLLKDGKILLGGTGSDGVSSGFFLMRLTNTGTVDSSFGKNGRTAVDVANYNRPQSIAVQADGKIIAAGYSYITFVRDNDFNIIYNMNFNLVRFFADGNVDSSFGENGVVQTDFGGVEEAYTVAVQADGKILVGGSTGALPPEQNIAKFFLVRYMPNGDVDSSFGIDGKVTTVFDNIIKGYISKVLIDSDGSIFACGTISGQTDFALAKYLPNGTLDESFGTGGKVTTRMNTTGSVLRDAVLLKDGKILTAGVTNYGNSAKTRPVLVQYLPDGSLDESFGTAGIKEIVFAEGTSDGRCINIQENKKIILASYIYDVGLFGIVRLEENGSIDSTFGTNGKIIQDIAIWDSPTEILIQNDGKIVVTGYTNNDVYEIFAARYYGDPTHPLITKIRRWIHKNILNFTDENGTANYYIVEQQNNGGGFLPVARIAANKSNNYSYDISNYTHATTSSHFRIKALYVDGSIVYSDAVTTADLPTNNKVTFYPNPVAAIVTIYGLDKNKDYSIIIRNKAAQPVLHAAAKSVSQQQLNMAALQPGIYFIELKDAAGEVQRLKIVKE